MLPYTVTVEAVHSQNHKSPIWYYFLLSSFECLLLPYVTIVRACIVFLHTKFSAKYQFLLLLYYQLVLLLLHILIVLLILLLLLLLLLMSSFHVAIVACLLWISGAD